MPLSVLYWGQIDPAPIWGGYLGALLYGCFMLAIGLLASSLTDSSMIAAFLSLMMMSLVKATYERWDGPALVRNRFHCSPVWSRYAMPPPTYSFKTQLSVTV